MNTEFNQLIRRQAATGVKRMTTAIKALERLQGSPLTTVYGTVSNPPTTPEIEALLDTPANIGQSFIALLVDSVNSRNWLLYTDGLNWYTITQVGTNIYVKRAGDTMTGKLTISAGGLEVEGATIFNNTGADVDFRIEGDTATNLFVVDAGLDAVRIGTTVAGALADFRNSVAVFNESGADVDLRVEGDNDANLLFADAGNDRIGIGTNVPATKLDVTGVVSTDGITNVGPISHTGTTVLSPAALTLVNGDNNNIALPANATYIRYDGPTGAYTITGIAGGAGGRLLILSTGVAQTLTIANQSANSTDINRIITSTNADIVPGLRAQTTFIYDGTDSRWRILSARGSVGAF